MDFTQGRELTLDELTIKICCNRGYDIPFNEMIVKSIIGNSIPFEIHPENIAVKLDYTDSTFSIISF